MYGGVFYLSGVREGEVLWRIRVAVEEVVHVVVGQLFQLCLADISQEIHREIHPFTTQNRQTEHFQTLSLPLLSSAHHDTWDCGVLRNKGKHEVIQ